MLRISKLADYATVLLVSMAGDPEALFSSQYLADRARLEQTTVAKLLKLLAQAGLVSSVRGATGGYRLTRAPELISIAEVLNAVDGPIGLTECSVHQGLCGHEEFCGTRANWRKLHSVIDSALRSVTLADMTAPSQSWSPKVTVQRSVIPEAV
jgi:FeS assembly SUF system regulator